MPLTKPAEKNIIINDDDENDNCGEEDQEKDVDSITSHLCINRIHSKQTLDKQLVLRRIRHRKRMNNFRSAIQSFVGSSSSSSSAKTNNKGSGNELKWVDDAFAAP